MKVNLKQFNLINQKNQLTHQRKTMFHQTIKKEVSIKIKQ